MSSRVSRTVTIILATLALLATAAAAWQWHRTARSGLAGRGMLPDTLAYGPDDEGSGRLATRPDAGLAAGLAHAAAQLQFDRFDPGGLPPPHGARWVSGVRRPAPGLMQEQARYVATQPAEMIESHYVRILGGQGWTRTDRDPPGIVAFIRGSTICRVRVSSVATRPDAPVAPSPASEFTVTVIRPSTD